MLPQSTRELIWKYSCPNRQEEATFSEKVRSDIVTYLEELSAAGASTTWAAHKHRLTTFQDWVQRKSNEEEEYEILATSYIEHLIEFYEYTVSTVCGHVSTLANFVGYVRQDDPEIVTARILRCLQKRREHDVRPLLSQEFGTLADVEAPSGASEDRIERIISYLRRSQFGSRTHAFTELVLATKSRPTWILRLDIGDYDQSNSIIEVQTSDQSLVGKHDIVSTREVELSEQANRALNEYLDRERSPVAAENSDPLFTTSQGRMSASTLRRSFRRTSQKLHVQSPSHSSSDRSIGKLDASSHEDDIVQPRDIRWYALTRVTE